MVRTKKNNSKTITLLILLYVFFTLVFPELFFNKILFVFILGYYLLFYGYANTILSAPPIIISIFVYGFFLSFCNYCDMALSKQFFLSVFSLLLIYPIVNVPINFEKILKYTGVCLIIVNLLFVLYASHIYSFRLPLGMNKLYVIVNFLIPESFFTLLIDYGETAIGMRTFLGLFDFMAHLGTTPFIYLPACLFFEDFVKTKKIKYGVLVLLSLFILLISSLRAPLFVTIGMLFFLFVVNRNSFNTKLISSSLVLLLSLYMVSYIFQETEILSLTESSNSTKIGHLKTAFSDYTILQFFGGKGLGSYCYSAGVGRYVAHTEITFLDYIRYFGFPLALIIYYKLVFPLNPKAIIEYKNKTEIFKLSIVFAGYLLISLTNPVLMNSMGILVVLWYWSKIYSYINKKKFVVHYIQ